MVSTLYKPQELLFDYSSSYTRSEGRVHVQSIVNACYGNRTTVRIPKFRGGYLVKKARTLSGDDGVCVRVIFKRLGDAKLFVRFLNSLTNEQFLDVKTALHKLPLDKRKVTFEEYLFDDCSSGGYSKLREPAQSVKSDKLDSLSKNELLDIVGSMLDTLVVLESKIKEMSDG